MSHNGNLDHPQQNQGPRIKLETIGIDLALALRVAGRRYLECSAKGEAPAAVACEFRTVTFFFQQSTATKRPRRTRSRSNKRRSLAWQLTVRPRIESLRDNRQVIVRFDLQPKMIEQRRGRSRNDRKIDAWIL